MQNMNNNLHPEDDLGLDFDNDFDLANMENTDEHESQTNKT